MAAEDGTDGTFVRHWSLAKHRAVAGSNPAVALCYLRTIAPSNWLKVVVAYGEGRGHIVTAYARRSMP
jgi:hypothetical protein